MAKQFQVWSWQKKKENQEADLRLLEFVWYAESLG